MVTDNVTEAKVLPDFEANYFGIEWIDTDTINVDHTYQRPRQLGLIKTISENWDWRACRTLAVSLRVGEDGENYFAVIDGQQRLTAARECNIEKLPCQVYIDLTPQQEAELFGKLNNSKKPTANDMFRAKIAEGDQEAKLIVMAVRNTGWELDLSNTTRNSRNGEFAATHINSASAILHAYRSGGVLHLQSVLNILHGWYGQHLAACAEMIHGFSSLLLNHKGKIDLNRLTSKLANETPSGIIGKSMQLMAAERSAGMSAYGQKTRGKTLERVLIAMYNKGLRNGKLEE